MIHCGIETELIERDPETNIKDTYGHCTICNKDFFDEPQDYFMKDLWRKSEKRPHESIPNSAKPGVAFRKRLNISPGKI